MTDTEVSTAFAKYYLQRATHEFAEDLDRIRNADDFKDGTIPLLVHALQQGASVFSNEEQRRVVTASIAKGGK
jgi:ribosome assembly protein 3